jgi:hypothetical protein
VLLPGSRASRFSTQVVYEDDLVELLFTVGQRRPGARPGGLQDQRSHVEGPSCIQRAMTSPVDVAADAIGWACDGVREKRGAGAGC